MGKRTRTTTITTDAITPSILQRKVEQVVNTILEESDLERRIRDAIHALAAETADEMIRSHLRESLASTLKSLGAAVPDAPHAPAPARRKPGPRPGPNARPRPPRARTSHSPDSRAGRMVAFLKEHGKATADQIHAALPDIPRNIVPIVLAEIAGLRKHGSARQRTYSL